MGKRFRIVTKRLRHFRFFGGLRYAEMSSRNVFQKKEEGVVLVTIQITRRLTMTTPQARGGSQLTVQLKPHQETAHLFFDKALRAHKSALCSDAMGLGKTVTAFALACSRCPAKNAIVLVMLPKAPKGEWIGQIGRHFDPNTVHMLNFEGAAKKRTAELQTAIDAAKEDKVMLFVLCTFGIVCTSVPVLNSHTWDFIIMDECQKVTNVNTKVSKAVSNVTGTAKCPLLGLSGTPVANSALRDMAGLAKSLYPNVPKMHDPDTISECRSLLRQTHMGRAISDVKELALPEKTVIPKTIAFKVAGEVEAYDTAIQRMHKAYQQWQFAMRQQNSGEREWRRKIYEGALQQVRGTATHLDLTAVRLGEMSVETARTSSKELYIFHLLRKIRRHDKHDKTQTPLIITSCSTTVLSILEYHLQQEFSDMELFSYTGKLSTQQRLEILAAWEACPNGVLLLSTNAGSTGMTLTHATVMIGMDTLAHPNWAVMEQVEARIFRIGQTKPVTLYRLATTGTIDTVVGGTVHAAKKAASMALLTNSTQPIPPVPSIYSGTMEEWKKYKKYKTDKQQQQQQQQQQQTETADKPLAKNSIHERREERRVKPY
jgi:SNF2 family DNA or RNA helicase